STSTRERPSPVTGRVTEDCCSASSSSRAYTCSRLRGAGWCCVGRPVMLELYGVSVRFCGLAALDGIDLRLPAGGRHALIGPNGAGKSTLLHAISATVAPTAYRVGMAARVIQASHTHR